MPDNKPFIGGVEPDLQRCLRCGQAALDTGWECTECGYDCMPHYCPPTEPRSPPEPAPPAAG